MMQIVSQFRFVLPIWCGVLMMTIHAEELPQMARADYQSVSGVTDADSRSVFRGFGTVCSVGGAIW